ncbi:MAG TPA: hypothetical protein VNB78_10195 [Sphingomicrobium sp.]|jgi:hypothetical protein|nr:hypothetical protein [Sphingomicrobium sp.]
MPRIVVLILVLALIVGALFFVSTLAREQPTRTIEVDVPQPSAPAGNAT